MTDEQHAKHSVLLRLCGFVRFVPVVLVLGHEPHRDALLGIVDAVVGKRLAAVLDEVEVDVPVVLRLAPRAHGEDIGVVVDSGEARKGRGLVEHALRAFCRFKQHALDEVLVDVVGDLEILVDAAALVRREVGDVRAHEVSVGHEDQLVVKRGDLGVEDADVGDKPLRARALDVVADLEGLEDQDHKAARKVGQRPLKGKSDRQSSRRDQRDDARHRHAENFDEPDDEEDIQKNFDDLLDHDLDDAVEGRFFKRVPHRLVDRLDEQQPHDRHNDRQNDLPAVGAADLDHFIHKFIHSLFSFRKESMQIYYTKAKEICQ